MPNKLKFLYSIYGREHDDLINKHELLSILRMLVGSNIPEVIDKFNELLVKIIIILSYFIFNKSKSRALLNEQFKNWTLMVT